MFLRRVPWCFMISIHAPREGGDPESRLQPRQDWYFNPRPPRGGRLDTITEEHQVSQYFNPRPPRGGRPVCIIIWSPTFYFNPRPPRGGRLMFLRRGSRDFWISIHAPREGGDYVFAPGLS